VTDAELLAALLDSQKDPVLFCDNDHVVRYLNRAAEEHYTGGRSLLGTSIFDCHDDESNRVIREVYAALRAGETERRITDDEKHRIYMRAVRGSDGALLGYVERYEPPRGA
jgi:PAS domain-containing protein